MIELRDVSKILGEFSLNEVNLRVEKGEYFVLLGPSGVGKTVLLELVSGLLSPDRGTISLRGIDITRLPPEKRNFALVYQDYALFPHLTVRDNIAYGLRARGESTGEARQTAAKTAELMGVGDLLPRRPETLSGGEKQRVALARALATKPKILLLDEPLAAVDPSESDRLRQVLRDINRKQGVTVLHVTHSANEALFLAGRVGVMMDGTVRQVGTPSEIFQSPSDPAVAEFLGLQNVFSMDEKGDGVCRTGDLELNVSAVHEESKYLWIRPEDIILSREVFESSASNQFQCTVVDFESSGRLYDVRVRAASQILSVLITHTSFKELDIIQDARLFATFKSTAVHVF